MNTGTPHSRGQAPGDKRSDRLQAALRELAARETAPDELDRILEPLRLGDRQRPRVRPAFRWAALAAAAVAAAVWLPRLAVSPAVRAVRPTLAQHRPGEYYQLRPLPTAIPGEEPETAAEAFQRLETPAPLPSPAPLEVFGPTEADPADEGLPTRRFRLSLGGRSFELGLTVPRAPAGLLLTVENGRIIAATTSRGAPLPPAILEALATLSLGDVPDGRVPARLSPLPAAGGPTPPSSGP